jgi:hypothetical protein
VSLIQIQGSPDVLRGLYDIEGLKIVRRSVKQHADTSWTVGGYATEAAIEAVRARGADVEVLATTAELTRARVQRRDAIALAERRDASGDGPGDGTGGEGTAGEG